MPVKRVLVLCTGNSCRSIMAEALINALGEGRYQAFSAGSKPAGYVHPESIAALDRVGIQINDPSSQSWDDYAGQPFDFVITVCDQAAGESCPVFSGDAKKLHWSTPDPAAASGSKAEIRKDFDDALLMLRRRIESELLR